MIDSLYSCFQRWSDKGSVYILSDPHFNDSDCKLMDRSWIDPETHLAMLNKRVFKNDTLVLLGDLGDPDCVKRIRGRKILLAGNHDILANYRDMMEEIYEGPLFIAEKILLSHEPVNGLPFCVNIHGHDHAGQHRYFDAQGCKHINVASNVCGWMPINLKEEIKNGLISKVPTIHRLTIDHATKNSIRRASRAGIRTK